MKILFTLLCIDTNHHMYIDACRSLINEILEKTSHNILLSTNSINSFRDLNNNSRIYIRDNISETTNILKYGGEFNYNLKYLAFKNIPTNYDAIIYLDCDIKLDNWTDESEELIYKTISQYEIGATRTNCLLKDEVEYLNSTGSSLFSHKITAYKIRETYPNNDPIYNSQLPSEHFLILKNNPEKIKCFCDEWSNLNSYLQSINGGNGSWGDGFEIGIAANKAGMTKIVEITHWQWSQVMGLIFNGHKK